MIQKTWPVESQSCNDMPALSIVIPVYNAASFLHQCLDSVCSQTLDDIEIICIDDCSTDNSLELIKSYQERDSRIILIEQESNQGPGAARNKSISIARGSYVGFVDADDWIDPDYFQSMLSVAISHNADIVYNSNIVRELPGSTEPYNWLGAPCLTEQGKFIESEISANYTNPSAYSHIYRVQYLDEIHCLFPVEYNVGEDKFFHIATSMGTKSIFAFSGPQYHYRKTLNSLTQDSGFFNIDAVRYFKDLLKYFGDSIYDKSFKLKLYNIDMFCGIDNDYKYGIVKSYLESISDYFDKSGVFVSDFDRYAIDGIIKAQSYEEVLKHIGKNPWIRYRTMERLKIKITPKISVIIPVYNTEQFVCRCLQSVCSQTLHDIEIICVNDCSTDDSLDVIKHFAIEDNRIRIIDLPENGGVSNARNIAMKEAKGEYLYFIDSDDWIDLGYLEGMYAVIEKNNTDIVINSNFINEYDDNSKNTISNFSFISSDGSFVSSKELQLHYPPVIWTRLYRRSFIESHGIVFPIVNGGAEDIFFAYACDLIGGSVFAYRGEAYHYYQRQTSAMHTSSRGFHYFESFSILNSFLNKNGISTNGIKLFYVESLIIDTEQKYVFVKEYLESIKRQIADNISLYNDQELFLVKIMEETDNYDHFISRYNPNIALSFVRNKMKKTL